MEDGFYWVAIDDDTPEVVEVIGTSILAVGDYSYYEDEGIWQNCYGPVEIKFLSGKLTPPNA